MPFAMSFALGPLCCFLPARLAYGFAHSMSYELRFPFRYWLSAEVEAESKFVPLMVVMLALIGVACNLLRWSPRGVFPSWVARLLFGLHCLFSLLSPPALLGPGIESMFIILLVRCISP